MAKLEKQFAQVKEQVGSEIPTLKSMELQMRIDELRKENRDLQKALEAVTGSSEETPETTEAAARPEHEERRGRDPRLAEMEREIGRLMDEVARGASTLNRVKMVLTGAHEEVQRLSVENEELRRKAEEHERLSQTDELTGLLNRQAFKTLAPAMFEMYRGLARRGRTRTGEKHESRMDVSFNAVYIDLNGFKEINDRIEHAAGDEALKQVAKALRSAMRDTDPIFRMGGDEFLILFMSRELPGGTRVEVNTNRFIVAERVKRALEGTGFTFSGVKGRSVEVPPITAMLGVAQFVPDTSDGLNEVVQAADAEALKLKDKKSRERELWESDPAHAGQPFPNYTAISYAQEFDR